MACRAGLVMTMKPVQACSICGKVFTGQGHNAQPFNDGRCCDDCNENAVVPALLLRGAAAEKRAKREGNGGGCPRRGPGARPGPFAFAPWDPTCRPLSD